MSDEDVVGTQGHRLDRIRLLGVTATGYHGVFPHERREGQTFVADVVAHLDTRRAAATDDLAHTLNYGTLAEEIAAVLAGDPADLVETVAERIAATVLAHPQVQAVDVAVHKPQAPITVPFGDVVVEVHRDRTWLPAAEPVVLAPATSVPDGVPAAPAPVLPPADLLDASLPSAPVDLPAAPPGPVAGAVAGTGHAAAADPLDDGDVVDAELVQDALDVPPSEPVEVVLAIGSNLGAAQDTLRDAVADLAAVPGLEVVDVSALARTAPVGGPEQPDFLNAVVIARTTLSPRDLLRATSEVERVHGRERTVHWGPRTLDVDIIVYGQVSAVTDDLELPHPRAHERAFVLQPWAQVRPDAVLNGLGGGPVAALAATAPDRDGVRWLALDWLTAPVPAALPDPGAEQDVTVQPAVREDALGPLDAPVAEPLDDPLADPFGPAGRLDP
ncbi:2-amino-4-hydroxy-6-hydroxymethyldihydropteridine diphosphokinase [Cellulomonas hominis]|uniref:2-amino-4-hydroxy-6- hydroxymethyldihydropteridine diphosphokinase n=1 Tax=Cellulomonas hominis TaxID=156981 RepID=UPI001B9B0D8C|nr:2-amino-4-hydroxy-6-hydroxymethyldihydropteridine diphosphokinase [Cellulomonas hominis]VTR76805.1 Dihydroneopterin aldolase [Cellulomonas hominis]